MKKTRTALVLAAAGILLATFGPTLTTARAQGPLSPPGAPAATMKTLVQVEPRTPISSAYDIAKSGSYYLTTSILVTSSSWAIHIRASDVTLDLNGFTVSCDAAADENSGILIADGVSNITIKNGFIRGGVTYNGEEYSGPGFGYGIRGSENYNVLVSCVSVAGVLNDGILLDPFRGSIVDSCTVTTAGGSGVVANTIRNSAAQECGIYGIDGGNVINSTGQSTGSSSGIRAGRALNCYGTSDGGPGINGSTMQNCYGDGATSGIAASFALNCYGEGGDFGVKVFVAQNCFGRTLYGVGLKADHVALACYGETGVGGVVGLEADIASTSRGFPNRSVNFRYDMP